MSDAELNDAAAKALRNMPADWPGWAAVLADWSPATKIEHAWIVQSACDPWRFTNALGQVHHRNTLYAVWLATAPPRARTEAAVAVLTQGDEA